MSKQRGAHDDLPAIMMQELMARQGAAESLIETILTMLLLIIPPEGRRDFMNALYASRAEAMQKRGDSALEQRTTIHLLRIIDQTTARASATPVGTVKN
jgi:hypothetical protein